MWAKYILTEVRMLAELQWKITSHNIKWSGNLNQSAFHAWITSEIIENCGLLKGKDHVR